MTVIKKDEVQRALSAIAYTLVSCGLRNTDEVVQKSQEIYSNWCQIKNIQIEQDQKQEKKGIFQCPQCGVTFEPQYKDNSTFECPTCGKLFL